jgi:heat shock protein HslJ
MSNDVEAEIRDALRSRALAITEEDLNRRDEPVRSGHRTMLAALAVAAVVAAIAVGVALASAPTHPSTQPGGGQQANSCSLCGPNAPIGIDWRLETVRDKDGTFSSPSPRVRIAFRHDGTLVADDSVNFYSGRYRLTPTGFVITDVASTAAGYAGSDPAVLATQAGMAAVLTTPTARTRGGDIVGYFLVLSAGGYTLTFEAGPPVTQPSTAQVSPTSTGTPTGAPPTYVHGSELPS